MQERQRLQKAGLCFRCKQPGHIASDTNFHPDAQSRLKPSPPKQGPPRNRAATVEEERSDQKDNVSESQRTTSSRNQTMDRRTSVVDDRSDEGVNEESDTLTIRTRRAQLRTTNRRATPRLEHQSRDTSRRTSGRSTRERSEEVGGRVEARFRKLAREARKLGYNAEEMSYLIDSDSDF